MRRLNRRRAELAPTVKLGPTFAAPTCSGSLAPPEFGPQRRASERKGAARCARAPEPRLMQMRRPERPSTNAAPGGDKWQLECG